jgi:hypothetical protein
MPMFAKLANHSNCLVDNLIITFSEGAVRADDLGNPDDLGNRAGLGTLRISISPSPVRGEGDRALPTAATGPTSEAGTGPGEA